MMTKRELLVAKEKMSVTNYFGVVYSCYVRDRSLFITLGGGGGGGGGF